MSTGEEEFDVSFGIPEPLVSLRYLRNKVNWSIKEERCNFLVQFYLKCSLPKFELFLRPKEIECLLWDSITYKDEEFNYMPGDIFIALTAIDEYKHKPDVDESGIISPRRATPIHHAVNNSWRSHVCKRMILNLFRIYNTFDVNYTDESGYTHFHAACQFSCDEVVQKFLESGQDPNCIWPETGDSPLHVALNNDSGHVAELLLRGGAHPSLANKEGYTPLHIICMRDTFQVEDLAEFFFKINDELDQQVQIDARDKFGQTPLQRAVISCLPHAVETMLNHGADLSSFVFPTLIQFSLHIYKDIPCKLGLMSGLLAIIDCLEKRGYELDRNDALIVMELFDKFKLWESLEDLELFDKFKFLESLPHRDERWYKMFVETTKTIMIIPSLSLYDLIYLRPQETTKRLTCADYYELVISKQLLQIHLEKKLAACCRQICEIMSRKFFRSWALDSFCKLTHYRLPVEVCEIIIEKLTNKDLYNICVAATGQTNQNGKINVITNVIKCDNESPVRARKAPKRLQIKWAENKQCKRSKKDDDL